jgi:hypothetical protein
MARKHLLRADEMTTREPWRDRFDAVLEDHVLADLRRDRPRGRRDRLDPRRGLFMSTVWACAFEDLLTRSSTTASNIVDDYLKRRGWKEPRTFAPI